MKIPWRREWQPTPVFLPGEFHGQGSLAGYSPWGSKELDITEQLTLSLSLFHAVVRNNPKRSHVPFSQFPYMVTSFKSQPACWFSQDTACFITTGISRGHTHFPLSTPGNLSSVFQLHNLSFQDYYTSEKKKKRTSTFNYTVEVKISALQCSIDMYEIINVIHVTKWLAGFE